MSWLQAHLITDKERAPLVELLFENLGALSVTLGDAKDDALLEPGPGETPLWNSVRVTGLFSGDTDADRLRNTINLTLKDDVSRDLRLERLEDQAWERAWMDKFHPMSFGNQLWICPHEREVEDEGAVVVKLDPGLAFGTGTHPTTSLCLQWLDRHPLDGLDLIDFGCGSGILAVSALALGAERVIATDHDPQALQATEQNAGNNALQERLTICPAIEPEGLQVDIVLANILASTLIELRPILTRHTRRGGRIVLSGILQEQAAQVSDSYSVDFEMSSPVQLEEWVLLEGRRR
jgi:ribosomal protein L11 methyltransferase